MATTTTLTQVTDKGTSTETDWRDGLVELPAGHVYGKTALTHQEWHRLHRRAGDFVTVVSTPDLGRHGSAPTSLVGASGTFRYAIGDNAATYGPHAAYSLAVMTEAEWLRINREATR